MTRPVIAYAAALVTLGILDGLWLGVVIPGFIRAELGPLLVDPIRLGPAAAFYLLYPVGVVIFAVVPTAAGGWSETAARGALFGFFCYATYDLTNWATLKGWSASFSLVDIAWGSAVSAAAATAARLAARRR